MILVVFGPPPIGPPARRRRAGAERARRERPRRERVEGREELGPQLRPDGPERFFAGLP